MQIACQRTIALVVAIIAIIERSRVYSPSREREVGKFARASMTRAHFWRPRVFCDEKIDDRKANEEWQNCRTALQIAVDDRLFIASNLVV